MTIWAFLAAHPVWGFAALFLICISAIICCISIATGLVGRSNQ